mmetsp:Transcript_132986/g.384588  ORF Transcript_132986/g.384588 Transcript_132986/m.384588 type:complete len:279 (-) Transcript_132986:528-1364(-)
MRRWVGEGRRRGRLEGGGAVHRRPVALHGPLQALRLFPHQGVQLRRRLPFLPPVPADGEAAAQEDAAPALRQHAWRRGAQARGPRAGRRHRRPRPAALRHLLRVGVDGLPVARRPRLGVRQCAGDACGAALGCCRSGARSRGGRARGGRKSHLAGREARSIGGLCTNSHRRSHHRDGARQRRPPSAAGVACAALAGGPLGRRRRATASGLAHGERRGRLDRAGAAYVARVVCHVQRRALCARSDAGRLHAGRRVQLDGVERGTASLHECRHGFVGSSS